MTARYLLAVNAEMQERARVIVELMAEGMSNKQIAEQLSYSDRTIKIMVGKLMIEHGANNRGQLLVILFRKGLIK